MWSLAREPVRRAIDDSLRQLEMGNPPVDIIDVRRKKFDFFLGGGPREVSGTSGAGGWTRAALVRAALTTSLPTGDILVIMTNVLL